MSTIRASSRARLRWPAQLLPVGSTYLVYANAGDAGPVSYARPITSRPVPAWPADRNRAGAGFGRGFLGLGPFGSGPSVFDPPPVELLTGPLADGDWTFAVVARDEAGNADAVGTLVDITLAGEPRPPGVPEATGYVSGTDTLTLEWDLSPDDQ